MLETQSRPLLLPSPVACKGQGLAGTGDPSRASHGGGKNQSGRTKITVGPRLDSKQRNWDPNQALPFKMWD